MSIIGWLVVQCQVAWHVLGQTIVRQVTSWTHIVRALARGSVILPPAQPFQYGVSDGRRVPATNSLNGVASFPARQQFEFFEV